MTLRGDRLPRELHPGAWWIWALGMATAATRTTNPLLLGAIIAVIALVVAARRGDSPWSRGFRGYVIVALVVVAVRVALRTLLDGQYGEHVLFRLPSLPLPDAAQGIEIGGAVSLEGLLAAFYDGLRLATLILCFGAANVLANPKRLLKSMPSGLHEIGVSITVALSMAPQLVESARRVHRARRLRGGDVSRTHLLRQVAIPVMTDALDRSLLLAAAMDARGHGRTAQVDARTRAASGALVLFGLCGVCIGVYGVLDATTPVVFGTPMLLLGTSAALLGLALTGRRVHSSRYRPDPWRAAESIVAASGVVAAAGLFIAGTLDPANLNPSLQPLQWPTIELLPLLAVLAGAVPASVAPPPRLTVVRDPSGARARPPTTPTPARPLSEVSR
jgi:energy-coupling factor transport system permease protein